MFALGATVYELATAHTLPSEGERWVALWEGKLMMLPEGGRRGGSSSPHITIRSISSPDQTSVPLPGYRDRLPNPGISGLMIKSLVTHE